MDNEKQYEVDGLGDITYYTPAHIVAIAKGESHVRVYDPEMPTPLGVRAFERGDDVVVLNPPFKSES